VQRQSAVSLAELEANAKLIAAAPEQQAKIDALADALEAVLALKLGLCLWQCDSRKQVHVPGCAKALIETALRQAGRIP